jgi:hypothetical protein
MFLGITDELAFSTAGSERLRIDNTGLVGIGTTNPSARLDLSIVSTTTPALRLRNGWVSASFTRPQIAFSYNNDVTYNHFINTRHSSGSPATGGNAIDFYVCDGTSGNSLSSGVIHNLTLESGRVGIGKTNPSAKLDVNGNTIITGSLTLSGSGHYVTGNVDIDGTLSATAKSFDIPHPTKDGMRLRYGSLESPYHGIRLTGDCSVVNGECLIYLPDYVSSLCKQEGSNVQVTNKKHGKVLWVEEINVEENYFIIKTDVSGDDENTYDFYWSFTAIRKDIKDLEVEIVI